LNPLEFGTSEFGCVISKCGPYTTYVFSQYSFLFAEVGHGFHGKPLYIESPIRVAGHPIRKIDGREIVELKVRCSSDGMRVVLDDELIELACKYVPGTVQRHTHLFGSNYVSVPGASVIGVASPKELLARMATSNEEIERLISHLSQIFNLEKNRFGMTGSPLMTGRLSSNDHDIVIYCSPEETPAIEANLKRIRLDYAHRAPAFGIDWPFRFRHPEFGIIDLFFAYRERSECPIKLSGLQIVRKHVPFAVTISYSLFGGFCPSIYATDSDKYPWLLVLGTATRGLFSVGETIKGKGTCIKVWINDVLVDAVMIEFPFSQVKNLSDIISA
jgi:hypothetical protein